MLVSKTKGMWEEVEQTVMWLSTTALLFFDIFHRRKITKAIKGFFFAGCWLGLAWLAAAGWMDGWLAASEKNTTVVVAGNTRDGVSPAACKSQQPAAP